MTRRAGRRTPPRKAGADQTRQPEAGVDRGGARAWWPAVVIAVVGVAAYANALHNPLVFDDASTIVENGTIRNLLSSLRGGPAQFATAGRPVVNFSFALDYAAAGPSPLQYHLTNLAILVLCGCLLYGVLRRILLLPRLADVASGHATGLAAATALLWTVHPLNTEVVDYVTQRTESLMALAYLATIYAALRGMSGPHPRRWLALSVVACAAGMAAKESMVTAPVAVLLIDAVLVAGSPGAALRARRVYYAALAATWIVLALLLLEGPRFRSAGFSSGIDPWTYLLNQAPMLVRYLRLAVLPVGLVLDYGLPRPVAVAEVLLPGLAILALLAATVVAWRLAPRAALPATLAFLLLAPTSSVVPIATEVGAERRMFLPLAALLALAVAALWQRVLRRRPRAVAIAALVVVAGLWTALTVRRNAEYRSGTGIWQTVVERWPQPRAHYNLGIALKAAGRRGDAIDEYRRALPGAFEAHYALGFELQADGRHDEAIEQYRMFIDASPLDINVPRAFHQLGRALLSAGRPGDAAAAFREMLARNPGNPDGLAGLADALVAAGRLDEAVNAYRELLGRVPNHPDAMMNMGIALVKLDRDAEARDLFARVTELQPANVAAHVNLAYALANTGRLGDAVREFRRAAELERDPAGRAEIEAAIGQLLGAH